MTFDYPCVADIIVLLDERFDQKYREESEVDWDEVVYEAISEWDRFFQDDEEWFDEEDTDIKDSLRDQVLEFISNN